MSKIRLSIIGCGSVARALAHLWHKASLVDVVDIVNRSEKSALTAAVFIGAGTPHGSFDNLQQADVFLIGCQDDLIEECLNQLLLSEVISKGNIIFHCSGSKSSVVLDKAKELGALIASLHPVMSFANPATAINSFEHTYCGLEGDKEAVEVLTEWVEAIGGIPFDIDADKKMLYHAASVFACNYLVALEELSLKAFAQSGVERELAMKILEPIVKGTADNIFTLETTNALTGPIARGDFQVVADQLKVVQAWDKDAAQLYKRLGEICVELAEQQGSATKTSLEKIKKRLSND